MEETQLRPEETAAPSAPSKAAPVKQPPKFRAPRKRRKWVKRLVIILVIFGLTLGCLMLFASANVLTMISESLQAAGDISEREGAATALLSGRQDKLQRAFDQYRDAGLSCVLFGLHRRPAP